MFLRVVLVCLALFSVAYCKPYEGTSDELKGPFSVLGRPVVPIEPNSEPQGRNLVLLLPILFPNQYYST